MAASFLTAAPVDSALPGASHRLLVSYGSTVRAARAPRPPASLRRQRQGQSEASAARGLRGIRALCSAGLQRGHRGFLGHTKATPGALKGNRANAGARPHANIGHKWPRPGLRAARGDASEPSAPPFSAAGTVTCRPEVYFEPVPREPVGSENRRPGLCAIGLQRPSPYPHAAGVGLPGCSHVASSARSLGGSGPTRPGLGADQSVACPHRGSLRRA